MIRARRREGDRRVGDCSCQAPAGEQTPRVDDVGEVEKRADQRPGNESALNRHRQPRQARAAIENSAAMAGAAAVAENHSVMPRKSPRATSASITRGI